MKRYFFHIIFSFIALNFLPRVVAQNTFDFVIETSGEKTEYAFIVDDAFEFEVDWGDGSGTDIFNGSVMPAHDYGEAGEWTLQIKGTASRIAFSTDWDCPYAPMLKDILTPVSTGVIGITSANKMFMDTKVTSFTAAGFFDETSGNVTDMSNMFRNADFNQDISGWDVSRVSNMNSMFQGNAFFDQDIGGWDVSSVTAMGYMFSDTPFNQDIGSWNVGNVTYANGLFRNASSFNQNIGGWDVSNITSTSGMFEGSAFNQDISGWDVSNVTNMYSMFPKTPFNQDISGWNVSNVTLMSYMFSDTPFDQDISGWDVSNVKGFTAFLNGSSFSTENYNKLLVKWSYQELEADNYFQADNSTYDLGFPAERRTYIENTFNWNFTDAGDTGEEFDLLYLHVTSMPGQGGNSAGEGFYEEGETVAVSATAHPFFQFVNWEATGGIFNDANAPATTFTMPADNVTITAHFDLYPEQENTYTFVIETTAEQTDYKFIADGALDLCVLWKEDSAVVYNGDVEPLHDYGEAGEWTIKVKGQAQRIAYKTTGGWVHCPYAPLLKDILTPVSDGVTGITSAEYMFAHTGVTAFTAGDFFDQASGNVASMALMFRNSAFNQDISGWDVSKVTDTRSMFERTPFNQDISGWDVSQVTNMSRLFADSDFNQDIGPWIVSNVTDMNGMFSGSEFNRAIGSWNVANVTNMAGMFYGSPFNHPIGNWDVNNVESMWGMFMFASDFNQYLSDWEVGNVTVMGDMFRSSDFNQDISSWDVSRVTNMSGMFRSCPFDQDISEWDVSNVEDFTDFLVTAALSTENYNKLLVRWSHLDLQENLIFHGGQSKYSADLPADRRDFLIQELNWTIYDGGLSTEVFEMYYIALAKSPAEGGVVEGDGLFNEGDHVTVHAVANPNFTFVNWTGENGDEVSTLADYSFEVPAENKTLTANFAPFDFEVTANTTPAGSGTVAFDPEKDYYHWGDTLTLTALPEDGYSFVEWSGDIAHIDDANAAEITVLMPADHITLTATFAPVDYTLTITIEPDGAGTVSRNPAQDHYNMGDVITLTATAETRYVFSGWTGDTAHLDDAGTAEATLTMPAGHVTLTATFEVEDVSVQEITGCEIALYPTPARSKLFVESTEMMQKLCLINLTGQVLSVETIQAFEHEISVGHLRPGIYFLQIHTTDRIIIEKVQVAR